VSWGEILAVFIVSHLVGDFLLQTSWQANNKRGGLGSSDPVARRALLSHIATYGLAFVPAFVWLATDIGWWALAIAALVVGPHLVQDDGRLITRYIEGVKHAEVREGELLAVAVDQSFHALALFGAALLAGALV
jgi:hypothetical protein